MLRLLSSLAFAPVLPQTLPVALPLLNAFGKTFKEGGAPQPWPPADDRAAANWSLAGVHNTVPRLSRSSITVTATRGFATTGIKEPGTLSTRQEDPLSQAGIAPHAGMTSAGLADHRESFMEHPAYKDMAYLENIRPIHKLPKDAADRVGMAAVNTMRWGFDRVTGYGPNMTPAKWLQRIIFLETVAGVPGMVAGMLRHLSSLRRFQRDAGWIHTLLEEAENERMHLLTFLELRKPGILFRTMVILAQGVFFNAYFIGYLIWPKACHSFVGYLEEEAVRTYTHLLKDIDEGKVWSKDPAPPIAIKYWGLKPDASMRDLILAVRADEACHSHVNHTLKTLKPSDPNPFALGKSHLP